jgi:hypothetical protein
MHATQTIGAGRQYEDPNDYVEAEQGKHKDKAEDLSDEEKFPIRELPMAPDPKPFSVGGGK